MPMTYGLEAFRGSVLEGSSPIMISPSLWKLTLTGIVYFIIGSISIKKMEKKILEKHFS
ncbi:hypothetical protein [Chengkuizengella axinellae]|uniref:ABC transporter permease n=1 Tax=Chengkuizengella axinellae TaxID=3064388 RepID=A0ABT9IYM6_9BACL|nr:hypothetical protein [Chengkuizengella sp. 2205SS18-9]MDP5274422.1 hypothetical protein [Chengkuizengella sp. 2205SS18-9]